MGFDAIWISPIVENIEGGYHGYWMKNIYQINRKFGTEEDLKELVKICHEYDIWIMIDVVANHIGPVGFDFDNIYPFNKEEHYHSNCDIQPEDFNGGNQWKVENCRLAGLPDLNQENSFVRETLKEWIKDLVLKYNIDGLRIDTIPEVPKQFWKEFQESANVFTIGENFSGNINYIANYQNYIDSLLNYPMYYTINNVFGGQQSMKQILNRYQEEIQAFKDISVLGLFVDNHDNERFLNKFKNNLGFQTALVFVLMGEGIPIIYYGSEQGFQGGSDPYNREILWNNMNQSHPNYEMISNVNKIRKQFNIGQQNVSTLLIDDDVYIWSRGGVLIALTNRYEQIVTRNLSNLPNIYQKGVKICEIFSQECVILQSNEMQIVLDQNIGYKIFVPIFDKVIENK